MVHIITGDIHSGKSTRFLNLYSQRNREVGLYAKKLYNPDQTIAGYNLVLLPIMDEIPFICLKESVESHGDYYMQGRFAFWKGAFKKGEDYILGSPSEKGVWIDEVGGLELKGLGFDFLLHTLIDSHRDVTFTVRTSLLNRVLDRYNITEYILL